MSTTQQAFLSEPRSVQKASSYQFPIRHDLKTLMQMLAIFMVCFVFAFHAAAEVQVWQANEYGSARYPAANATDGNAATFSITSGDFPNEFWMADLGQVFNLDRIEIASRLDCCANRHAGLVLRIYDAASNNISSATLTDVGLGGTYTHTLTPGTPVRWIRVGLENGQPNGGGDFFVELGEVRAYSGTTNVLKPSIFIQVGAGGAGPFSFDTSPGAADGWTTASVGSGSTSYSTVAQIDATAQTIIASNVVSPFVLSGTVPPSANAQFRYNTAGHYLQCRPTSVGASVLMATLINATGLEVSAITVSYAFNELVGNLGEELPGWHAYFSLTGTANSWAKIPAFSTATPGTLSATLNLGTWPANGKMHIIWLDDNANNGGLNEGAYTLDNFSIIPTLIGGPNAVTLSAPANGSSASAPAVINLAASATAAAGATVSRVAYYYTNSGAVTFVGSSAAGTTYPVATASLGVGNFGFYAVMTNSLGAITNSLTNVVTVTAILTNLTFLQQPTNAGAGVVMVPEVRVGATNSVGAAMAGIPVTLSLTGSGTLGGTITQNTDGSGIAHFANLSVDVTGVKTLTATNAGSGVSRTSFSFTITNTTFPILVGAEGSGTNSFNSVPPVTEWSTFNIEGDHNTTRTDAQWDATMATNNAANITSPLGNQGAAGTASLAYWRSDLSRIVTQPTGTSSAAVLLMATLRNTSGGTVNTLNVAYVMSDTVAPTTEGRKGHRVYYSVNGTNWITVGNFDVTDGTSTNIAFAMPALAWAPDSLLYVVWLDEDGASPDGDYGIDAISFTPSTGPSVVLTQPAHGSTYNAPATINLAAAASGGSGSVSNVAYYYTTNGVATCVGTSSSGPTYPVSVTNLAAGSYGFYAVMTNSLGVAAKSLTNVVLARGPLLLKDTFDLTSANPNAADVNFQIVERQSGALAPITYAKGLEPVFSQVGNSGSPFELLLAGRAAGFGGAVSLDHDFVESPDIGSSSVIEFDVNPVLICSGCNVTGSSWVAVTFGSSSSSRNQFPQSVDGMGILFRGNGQYQVFNVGQSVGADAYIQNADHLFHHVRITLTETNFGNPFSGTYPVIVRAFVDGNVTPFFSFVRTNGFAHNYISLIAEGEGGGGDGVVRHLVDNLTISLEPVSRPELSVALSGGNAVLSWPAFATGYQIYTSSNLVPPVEWSPLTNAVINCGTNFCVSVPINGQRAFFRLAK